MCIHVRLCVGVLVLAVISVSPIAAQAVDGVEGDPAVDPSAVQDRGTVERSVELAVPSELHVYHTAYVAEAADVSQDEITDWEQVRVDASLQVGDSPLQRVDPETGLVLFTNSVGLDLSRFDAGTYYIFFWGCSIKQDGNSAVPGDCRWLEPYRVEKTTDVDFTVTYMDKEYEYADDGMWERDGEQTDLVIGKGDYVEIHVPSPDRVDVVTFDETTGQTQVQDDLDQVYNQDGGPVLWHADQAEEQLALEDRNGGIAPVTVRDRCDDGSWNGDECTDMFNIVAVPLAYPQSDFDEFYSTSQDVITRWAEAISPMRHRYDDPRKTVKLHLLEPEDEYSPKKGPDQGKSLQLSGVSTDMCYDIGPHPYCPPAIPGCTWVGGYDLNQITERAARDSRYRDRFDQAMGLHQTSIFSSELPDGTGKNRVGGCSGTPADRFVLHTQESINSITETMGHELGHALGLCHTRGDKVTKDTGPSNGEDDSETTKECDLSKRVDPSYHPVLQGCMNDPDISGKRSIMNYCDIVKNRVYWGDPDTVGTQGNNVPYTVVDQWMRHYINGASAPNSDWIHNAPNRVREDPNRIRDAIDDVTGPVTDPIQDRVKDITDPIQDGAKDVSDRIQDGIDTAGDTVCDSRWTPC